MLSGRARNWNPELLANALGSSIHTQWLLQKEVHRAGDQVTKVGAEQGLKLRIPSEPVARTEELPENIQSPGSSLVCWLWMGLDDL